jgi:putative transcriptional regulator
MSGTTGLPLPWLLVATPQLQDPNFKKSVVLIVDHGAGGAMGFIINRPLTTPVAAIVTDPPGPIPGNVPAWLGGPVETSRAMILHRDDDAGEADSTDGGARRGSSLSVSASPATLRKLIAAAEQRNRELADREQTGQPPPLAAGTSIYPYRFLVGYAGWGAGQLEAEIRDGAWIQVPATDGLVFGCSWSRLWEVALETVGVSAKAIAPAAQPYLN